MQAGLLLAEVDERLWMSSRWWSCCLSSGLPSGAWTQTFIMSSVTSAIGRACAPSASPRRSRRCLDSPGPRSTSNRWASPMRSNAGRRVEQLPALVHRVADVDTSRSAGSRFVIVDLVAADVLDLGGQDAALERDQARQLVVLAVVALDDDLAIERERHDRGRLRRDRVGEALADEAFVAVHRDRAGLERRVGRVLEPDRAEREVLVAALALGVVEVHDLAVGLLAAPSRPSRSSPSRWSSARRTGMTLADGVASGLALLPAFGWASPPTARVGDRRTARRCPGVDLA